jgi:hypothetical protein
VIGGVTALNYMNAIRHALLVLRKIAVMVWASPYSIIGLSIGCVGILFGGRARIVGPTIEFYDGGIKWFVHRLPHGQFTLALTLGHVILGQTDAALAISRKHEAVHVAQYERWGPLMLPAYLLSSCYVYLAGKRFYRDNPFEREAYDKDGGEYDK